MSFTAALMAALEALDWERDPRSISAAARSLAAVAPDHVLVGALEARARRLAEIGARLGGQ